ncbi:hypothetical protein BJP47_17240 [Paenibacillus odorifer]|nr:hypothetical protein BJP47_17240 [Paenibacillus odorifer]
MELLNICSKERTKYGVSVELLNICSKERTKCGVSVELLNICSKERTKYGAYEVYNITRGRIVSAVVLYWDGETRAEMPLFCCKGLVSRERRAKVPLICSNELV